MDENSISLDIWVEIFITWLLDNKPYVFNICTLRDVAVMFSEERGLEISAEFMDEFRTAVFRFLSKLLKAQMPRQTTSCQPTVVPATKSQEREEAPVSPICADLNQCSVTSRQDTTESPEDGHTGSDSPPLITTPIIHKNPQRLSAEMREPLFKTLLAYKSLSLKKTS